MFWYLLQEEKAQTSLHIHARASAFRKKKYMEIEEVSEQKIRSGYFSMGAKKKLIWHTNQNLACWQPGPFKLRDKKIIFILLSKVFLIWIYVLRFCTSVFEFLRAHNHNKGPTTNLMLVFSIKVHSNSKKMNKI